MTATERFECSAVSASNGEALTGTASRLKLWLMVEQPGPWGHDALVDSGFPPDVGSRLRDLGRRLGVRVLLIKRRDRLQGPRRCFLAYTGVHDRRIRTLDIADPEELLALDVPSLVETRFETVGEPFDEPLFLVCTHGKHDQCCARYGAPAFRALAGFENAWECTHIGGDRFAGNIVCFPHGMYFGRVAPSEAARTVESYAAGVIILERYRGRSAFPRAVQAAEEHIRWQVGLTGVDDLNLESHQAYGSTHIVRFTGPDGAPHVAEVEVDRLDPRLLTCKATHPHAPRSFTVRLLETVED
ncbi:MAG: sucrase ferredoxin [Actinomycetota bacterium]